VLEKIADFEVVVAHIISLLPQVSLSALGSEIKFN
jgi:hypothetical protein